ncbi:MAG: enolase C-terminal domain-like protein, partial [Candidatus Latescibacterota bacterium]
WFEQQAIDVCQVDISHAGGISELMRIAAFAEVYGIRVAPHNPYGPVALAAAAHAAAAMPNFLILEHCRLRPWFNQVQTQAIPLNGGYVEVAELARRSGLGIELDWDLVRSRPHQPLGSRRTVDRCGAAPLC